MIGVWRNLLDALLVAHVNKRDAGRLGRVLVANDANVPLKKMKMKIEKGMQWRKIEHEEMKKRRRRVKRGGWAKSAAEGDWQGTN